MAEPPILAIDEAHARRNVFVDIAVYSSALHAAGTHVAVWFHTDSGYNAILQVLLTDGTQPVRPWLLRLGLPMKRRYFLGPPVYANPNRARRFQHTIPCGVIPGGRFLPAIATIQSLGHKPHWTCKKYARKLLKALVNSGHLTWTGEYTLEQLKTVL